jgi:hypothetical protein
MPASERVNVGNRVMTDRKKDEGFCPKIAQGPPGALTGANSTLVARGAAPV